MYPKSSFSIPSPWRRSGFSSSSPAVSLLMEVEERFRFGLAVKIEASCLAGGGESVRSIEWVLAGAFLFGVGGSAFLLEKERVD